MAKGFHKLSCEHEQYKVKNEVGWTSTEDMLDMLDKQCWI